MHKHLTTDELTIDVKIDDESQIFSDYGYNEDNLNTELSDYFYEAAERVRALPKKDNFKIKIHTNNNDLRLPEITRCIHRHYHNAYDNAKRQLHNLFRYALVLFGLSAIFLLANYFAEVYVGNFFLTEIMNIAAWVFVWAAVEVIFLQSYSVARRCTILRRLAFAEVSCSYGTQMASPIYV